MKKRSGAFYAIIGLSVACLVFTGCSHSSTSTTTFSTSVTDENGETTTKTTTTTVEDGNKTTEESTVVTDADGVTLSEDGFVANNDNVDIRKIWYDTFNYGAEGVSENGDTILMAYDDTDLGYAAMMVIDQDDYLTLYGYGEVEDEGDQYVIYDVDGDMTVPFVISESNDDYMVFEFQDGDKAQMYYLDQETIIEKMVSIVESMGEEE
ncbi:MAG: hypothetical protein K6B28_13710 [Lachnospiraceae bacterium]|nr:hypothetical protein [Lachnospiraceae bacterium]